ncbi:hypothetical protein K490DRAFT_70412 [Saccharata proteae CBS 121410]|uniref:Uncharacterized protein n=1 Tax=Saccharata proteae CBS 121410 TaxID=1314787 RepID=A0A9P4LYH9_9PEZI|nr:hypothetical protein K490DRAFT_70412 [Saccharata proteae CBS 121410]
MADVRSLLRAERAARSQPSKQPVAAQAQPAASKKRKARDDDGDGRKRAKGPDIPGVPQDFFDESAAKVPESRPEIERTPSIETTQFTSRPAAPEATTVTSQPEPIATVDDDEWAAFEREMATPPPEQKGFRTANGAAVISAPAMSAEEVAAKARQEQSQQRGLKEAEMEAEEEDAARHLEEEFDEMESLEQRVRRLREKREALRQAREEGDLDMESEDQPAAVSAEAADEESDEDEDEDFDDWRFRPA